nr:MAG TPA: hypothetical protein [Caudoviricetes sp.]
MWVRWSDQYCSVSDGRWRNRRHEERIQSRFTAGCVLLTSSEDQRKRDSK